jgi:hypothetical protein
LIGTWTESLSSPMAFTIALHLQDVHQCSGTVDSRRNTVQIAVDWSPRGGIMSKR